MGLIDFLFHFCERPKKCVTTNFKSMRCEADKKRRMVVFRRRTLQLTYDLKSVRAYLLKKSFRLFWNYTSPYWAEWYLKKWSTRAKRSRLDPMKKASLAKSVGCFWKSICRIFQPSMYPRRRAISSNTGAPVDSRRGRLLCP
ncbi:hypothetical protein EGM51_12850 [Verrucomicrobia bacterium S94]|nr:hypothetical protein EGM51_12850 [Verrucomicrobia bacterium S94]